MQSYGFDPQTGVYTGTRQRQVDPKESKLAGTTVYTGLSRYETDVDPPAFGDKQIPVWDGNAWNIVPDHRGETWYTSEGSPTLIKLPGPPADKGLVKEKPPEPITAGDVIVERQRRIRALLGAKDEQRAFELVELGSREATKILNKGRKGQITPEDEQRATELETLQEMVDGLVAKSHILEDMDPIPEDYTDDKYWQ